MLAILAAITVPQFASTTDDVKLAALDRNLALMRDAIARYKAEHRRWPGKLTSMGATC